MQALCMTSELARTRPAHMTCGKDAGRLHADSLRVCDALCIAHGQLCVSAVLNRDTWHAHDELVAILKPRQGHCSTATTALRLVANTNTARDYSVGSSTKSAQPRTT